MREAAQWLVDRDERLWNPGDLVVENLSQRCRPEKVFVGEIDGKAAVCALIQSRDFLWPDDDAGLIVHKLAVRRAHAGKGFARDMLEFAEQLTRERGRMRLRLDCADRPKLRAFYENAGFRAVSAGKIGTLDVVLYEKTL